MTGNQSDIILANRQKENIAYDQTSLTEIKDPFMGESRKS